MPSVMAGEFARVSPEALTDPATENFPGALFTIASKLPGNHGTPNVNGSLSSRSASPATELSCFAPPSSNTSWDVSQQAEACSWPSRPPSNWNAEFPRQPQHQPHRPQADNMNHQPHSKSPLSDSYNLEESTDRESDVSEYYEDTEDGEEGDEDEWSGQDDNIELAVIAAFGEDLDLAVSIIQRLRKDRIDESTRKIHTWQYTTPASQESSPAEDNNEHSEAQQCQSTNNSRNKRRRLEADDQGRNREEDSEEEEEGDPSDIRGHPQHPNDGIQRLRLACPFFKLNPDKYSQQNTNSESNKKHPSRACSGPGFKDIPKLREHLKRVHKPVQCERCYEVFSGSSHASCIENLRKHRRQENGCSLGDSSLRAEIDDAQWAALSAMNKGSSKPKVTDRDRVTRWFEIWMILFPGQPKPKSPYYDKVAIQIARTCQLGPMGPDTEGFVSVFMNVLDAYVAGRNIDLTQDYRTNKPIFESIGRRAFNAFLNIHKTSTDNSSGMTRPTNSSNVRSSLIGGSSTQDLRSRNSRGLRSRTGTTTTSVPSLPSNQPFNPRLPTVNVPAPQFIVPQISSPQISNTQSLVPGHPGPMPATTQGHQHGQFPQLPTFEGTGPGDWMVSPDWQSVNVQYQAMTQGFDGTVIETDFDLDTMDHVDPNATFY